MLWFLSFTHKGNFSIFLPIKSNILSYGADRTCRELLYERAPSGSGFLDKPDILPCTYRQSLGNGLAEVIWAGYRLLVPEDGDTPFDRVAIHPREVYLSPLLPPGPPENRFQARVKAVRHASGMAHVTFEVGDQDLNAQMTTDHLETLPSGPGTLATAS